MTPTKGRQFVWTEKLSLTTSACSSRCILISQTTFLCKKARPHDLLKCFKNGLAFFRRAPFITLFLWNLSQVACQNGYKVVNVTEGFCAKDKNTVEKTGTDSDDCDVIKGCPVTNEPVCGSNNITYQNECSLKQINCQQKLSIVSEGTFVALVIQ